MCHLLFSLIFLFNELNVSDIFISLELYIIQFLKLYKNLKYYYIHI